MSRRLWVLGVVAMLAAMLSQPAGLISALSFLASLFLAISLLDELATSLKREPVPSPIVGAGAQA